MLGRRKKQQTFFDVIGLPHPVAPDTFYGRMGSLANELFRDEDLKALYCDDNGRPSLPPSLMCGISLLQFHDDVETGLRRIIQTWQVLASFNLPGLWSYQIIARQDSNCQGSCIINSRTSNLSGGFA